MTKNLTLLLLLSASTSLFLSIHPTAPAKVIAKPVVKTVAAPSTTTKASATAPYAQDLIALKSIPENVKTAWDSLHAKCLQVSTNSRSTLALTPAEINTLTPLFNTNLFSLLHNQCQPTTFPKLLNDPQGTIHTAYATTHIAQTCARLGSICHIAMTNNKPTVQCKGDNRDFGIIVNIANNSDAQFSINQTATNGTSSTQIGLIVHGLNEVNLHTAALQAPANSSTAQATSSTASTQMFELQELNAQNPTIIKLQMMSGKELITFLESLPRKDQKVVEMNGLPTSSKFLAESNDWYFVLIQNPTASTATTRNPDQRIQAINVSKLSGPYLLTIQINPFTIDLPATDTANASTMDIFQPSINTVLTPKNKFADLTKCPLIILPQFVWNLPDLQALWMLQTTTYLAALTDFKLFGPNTFANAYEYFKNLGYFDVANKTTYCIDGYNTLTVGNALYDAPVLIGSALYETNIDYATDMPLIYSGENKHEHIVANNQTCFYINFQTILHPLKSAQKITPAIFTNQGFNTIYATADHQSCTFICSIPANNMEEGAFATLKTIKPGIYQLTWADKKNRPLLSQYLYTNNPLSSIEIRFLSQTKNWSGSFVPNQSKNSQEIVSNDFKVLYEAIIAENKYRLEASLTSPIDKNDLLYTSYFSKFPITELYYDLSEKFKGINFTRCHIIQNANLPSFLSNLSQEDWANGIYLVTSIKNNNQLSAQNPGLLTVSFYDSNKTLLGNIESKGLYKNNPATPGIRHSVSTSTIHSNAFKPLFNIFISTGVLLKYSNN